MCVFICLQGFQKHNPCDWEENIIYTESSPGITMVLNCSNTKISGKLQTAVAKNI